MVLQLGVVLLEIDVVVLEVIEVVLKSSHSSLGSVEVVLVSSLHGLDVSGAFDDVTLELTDLGLEVLVGLSDLVEVQEDVISLLLDALEQFTGGLGHLQFLSEVVKFSLEVSVVVALLLDYVGEVVDLLLELSVLAQQLGSLLLDGGEGRVQRTDLVTEALEGIGVSLLGSDVVVARLGQLGLVDVGASQLDSELVVLVLELGVLDLDGVEPGLKVINGIVGRFEVSEDLGVVSFELEDHLVELESLFLEFLGGLHEGLPELFAGVVAVVDLSTEVVDFSLPGLLFPQLEVEVVDDSLEVFKLILIFVNVTASFGVHEKTGHVGSGLRVGALGLATITVTETFGGGGTVEITTGSAAGRTHEGGVDQVGVGHVVELVEVDTVTHGGQVRVYTVLGLIEVSVDHLVHVVVQLGLRVTVTLGGRLRFTGSATGVHWAGATSATADGFFGGTALLSQGSVHFR